MVVSVMASPKLEILLSSSCLLHDAAALMTYLDGARQDAISILALSSSQISKLSLLLQLSLHFSLWPFTL